MKLKWFEENFLCLKPYCITKNCTLYLFSNNLCIYKKGNKSYVRKCAFSLLSVWRTIFYLFDRFTSNIRSSYICNSVFIFVLQLTREHVLYDFISNDFFPERKCISDRRRRRKEIQVNVELESLK